MKKEKAHSKKEIEEKLQSGWILSRILFEIVGNPKKHVVDTLNGIIKKLEVEENFIILNKELGEPEEKNGLFSSFIEIEALVFGLEKFIYISVNFTPANIEILRPEEFMITGKNMTEWLNDLLNYMHTINTNYRQKHFEDEDLKRNFNYLLRNAVMLSLDKEKTAGEIGKSVGIPEEFLIPFLDAMIKEKKLIKNEDKYKLAK